MLPRKPFQLVLTSFSFEPEIDLKALVQSFLPLVQDLSIPNLKLWNKKKYSLNASL